MNSPSSRTASSSISRSIIRLERCATTVAVVGLSDQGVETLVVDMIETPSMKCARADFAGKATADQAVDEVVRLLPVRDAGEAAVPGAR